MGLQNRLQSKLCGISKRAKPYPGYLVRCLKNRGRGSLFKGGTLPKGMVPDRAVRFAYQPPRTSGSQGGSFKICQKGGHYSIAFGQQSCLQLYPETGGDKKQHLVKGGLRTMGGNSTLECPTVSPPLGVNQRECGSRFSVTSQNCDLGVGAGPINFQSDNHSFQSPANPGRICIEKCTQTSTLFFMGARSPSFGEGCPSLPVGPHHIHLPSSPPDPQDPEQGKAGQGGGDLNLSFLAHSPVVAPGSEPACEQTPPPPPLQGHTDPCHRRADNCVSGASGGLSHFRENLIKSLNSHELDSEDLNFISNHLSTGSAASYGYSWKKFASFCSDLSIDPFSCPPSIIVKYIHLNFKSGAKYRTLNNIRSTISKFHIGFSGIPAGQHHLVIKALKAAFRLRPPLPRYKDTFDIKPVLTLTKQVFGNNELLNVKNLSYKCLFLTAFTTLSRISTVKGLGSDVEFYENHCIVPLLTLEKHSRGTYYYSYTPDFLVSHFQWLIYQVFVDSCKFLDLKTIPVCAQSGRCRNI